ncbi:CDP-alcohol phosphatidyltransferase [Longimonas halophila]|uniref:CDP-alcohol phosphatidyltransferase n=1 Tax=Longimonas halophila TaxID=1469170 RepID=A0A2H3NN27_9BACT|nr:CDP-alcohol phosphatidyltransferase family protein [Longimonas halophila]PEN08296.1 CDP-alcohol phosphatidyltransferase [Longimonas halophila]
MTARANEWPNLGRFWTIPNALSLLRLVLVLPIAWLIWQDGPLEWVVGLVLVAILTDWFDGRLARWLGTVSEWGKVLDPLADKAAGGLAVLALTFRASDPNLPVWFLLLVLVRDGAIVAGSAILARRVGKVVMSAWLGKAATTWLAITVLAALLRADAPVLDVCVYMTAGLLVVSFFVYTWHFIRTAQAPEGQKKVYQMDLSATRGHPDRPDSTAGADAEPPDQESSSEMPSREPPPDTETQQARSGTSSPNTS